MCRVLLKVCGKKSVVILGALCYVWDAVTYFIYRYICAVQYENCNILTFSHTLFNAAKLVNLGGSKIVF
jgi:hypothetical protein